MSSPDQQLKSDGQPATRTALQAELRKSGIASAGAHNSIHPSVAGTITGGHRALSPNNGDTIDKLTLLAVTLGPFIAGLVLFIIVLTDILT